VNRHQRRRAAKMLRVGIDDVVAADGDRCSVCRVTFMHNSKTFYGRTSGGALAVVGECCVRDLISLEATGIYLERDYADLPEPTGKGAATCSPEVALAAVSVIQERVSIIDEIARRGGITSAEKLKLRTEETAWKADDAAWFKAHPDRSHRLRRVFDGELEANSNNNNDVLLPEFHEIQILVRQVKPGMRIRRSIYRDLRTLIPDVEAVIHAMFDLFEGDGKIGQPISVQQVENLARRYEAGTWA
jgi:hypothetical protein